MFNVTPDYIKQHVNSQIKLCGCVYKIRKASGLSFVWLRNGRYTYQAVYIPDLCTSPLSLLSEGAYISVCGDVAEEKRAEYGFEITIRSFGVISVPSAENPFSSAQTTIGAAIDTAISNPSAAIKHARVRAILEIRSAVIFAFTEYMQKNGYTAINTPKITAYPTSADYINVRYFDKNLSLANSPDLYKIMAVGGLDKVYETGAAYFGRHGNSLRHLNEYTRLDFETAYATVNETMEISAAVIKHICGYISDKCKSELDFLEVTVSVPDTIPTMTHAEAMAVLGKPLSQPDLDPTDEKRLCELAIENHKSDYIFITEMPTDKRPFYEKNGKGFVLLCKGIEIASGGEHISDLAEQTDKLSSLGINIYDYDGFLSAHKYALPPISGGAFGLERFVMALADLTNIREATFIARDFKHIL